MKPVKIHWRLLQGGEQGTDSRALMAHRETTGLPDLGAQRVLNRGNQASRRSMRRVMPM